jgi:4-amino-4-deoxy-L-arabinose transferase-like glycosyltransferase
MTTTKKRLTNGLSGWRVVAALLAIHVVLAVSSMLHTSLTWDEPSYIGIGRQFFETGNPHLKALQLHPPLAYYVNSLFLFPLKFEPDRFSDPKYLYHEYIGLPLVFESQYSLKTIIFLTRAPFVILSVLLGLLVHRWAKDVYGGRAALFAVFLYAFCPTVLAHCRLATADLLLAFTMTLALYLFYNYLKQPSGIKCFAAGVALGLAFLSKFIGLLLIPILLLLMFIDWRKRRATPSLEARPHRPWPWFLLIFVVAGFVVWAGYGFQFGLPFIPEWLKPNADRLMREKPFWRAVDALAKHGIRVPAYSYALGIYTQLAAARAWQENFLFGNISASGWWYFYWAAFLIKTPLPFLILIIAAFVVRVNGNAQREDTKFLLASLIPLVLFFSFPTKINIGIRYILPLFPLLCIFAGRAGLIQSAKWKLALGMLALWYADSALWIHPHYLAYFNEFVGGPSNGYKYLVDSNLDWGQSLDGLTEYFKENKISDAKIKYFGPPGVMERYGLENADVNDCEPSPGVWAVSATYLQNLYVHNRHCHDWLKKLKPEAVIGYSIFIYRVSESDISETKIP